MKPRNLLRLAGVALIGVILFVLSIPTLFMQTTVRGWIVDQWLAQRGIAASIESLSLGWFRPVQANGVSFGPVGKPALVVADEVTSDRTLFKALVEGVRVGELTMESPRIHIWIDQAGSNLQFPDARAPAHVELDAEPGPTKEERIAIDVHDAELWIKTPTLAEESNVFRGVDALARLQRGEEGRLLIVEPSRVLDHVQISPELCRGGLKYILPVLAEATWTKGELSVELDACVIDLDHPTNSLVSGRLVVHNVQAGIKNEVLGAVGERFAGLWGQGELQSIHLVEESVVTFQVRDGLVWHEGAEFGLPRLSEELVVRTSGSVAFDESLNLTAGVPMPLHLIAGGAIAQALTKKEMTLQISGTLSNPKVKLNENDFVSGLISNVGNRLAEEERPLESVIEGFRDVMRGGSTRGDSARSDGRTRQGDEDPTRIFDRVRRRRERTDSPFRRLLGTERDDG